VVIVDGLDNCEQERMVQTLDSLELLFCARINRPFIALIAVDPHIIITAINHNINSALTGTELTGHHYLKVLSENAPFIPCAEHHQHAVLSAQRRLPPTAGQSHETKGKHRNVEEAGMGLIVPQIDMMRTVFAQ
jgi:hypothetical protein